MAIKVESTAYLSGEDLNRLIKEAIEKETGLEIERIVYDSIDGSIAPKTHGRDIGSTRFTAEVYGITVEFLSKGEK